MGIEIKLSDKEFPVSPIFIDFLAHIVEHKAFTDAEWYDQLSEALNHNQRSLIDQAPANAARIINDPAGQKHLMRAYQLTIDLMTGKLESIQAIQNRFHFINVIGVPRNGGTYLTQELYRALGYDPKQVPNVIAHDGFPEASPFLLNPGYNSWTISLHTMAEFLTMVEIFFSDARTHTGKIVVPKKLTKGTYAGAFFQRVLGESVEHILTVRHPVTSCISTYDKSGGLPDSGKFSVRSNIEEWVKRDLVYTGCSENQLSDMDYFDAYLKYWELYHYYLATTGLSASQNIRVVAYGRDRMEQLAQKFHYQFDSGQTPGEFKVFSNQEKHPDWMRKAQPAIDRVAEVWQSLGLTFPLTEIAEAW